MLDRLQEADNVTWERVCQTAVGEYESFDGDGFEVKYTVSYEELFDDAKEAWLQHCIQEAIRARGWKFILMTFTTGITPFAKIFKREPVGYSWNAHGDTEAEALGWAYLAVIEGTCQSAAGLAG